MSKRQLSYIFSVVVLLVTIYTILPERTDRRIREFNGQTMGTIRYTVKVAGAADASYQSSIDSLLQAFNASLSTYIPDSEISQFNQSNEAQASRMLLDVYRRSVEIYELTGGAFDPTVGPLVNRWGFGPDKKIHVPDSAAIDSLLLLVGLEKVALERDVLRKPDGVYLDFSAIAKGQAVDEVGRWLEQRGVQNYMVEIGGEVRCRGTNEKDQPWKIGIEDPTMSQLEQRLFAIAQMSNRSLATSGNYRNFYQHEGKTYAHIVDPRSGYTAQHSLLSASVFAPDCMSADAFATAFMVLGLEESLKIVEANPELDAIFIYRSGDQLDIYVSTGMAEAVELVAEL